jgi:hypothetical protein
MPEKEITGALYFSALDPVITGHLVIAGQHFEICGVRTSKIRADFTAKQFHTPAQTDLFDDASGSGES